MFSEKLNFSASGRKNTPKLCLQQTVLPPYNYLEIVMFIRKEYLNQLIILSFQNVQIEMHVKSVSKRKA